MIKKHNLLFAVGIIAILLITFWGIVFNRGTLEVTSSLADFSLEINDQAYQCKKTCSLKLPPKGYKLELTAPGKTPFSTTIYLLRQETETVNYQPLSIPSFNADFTQEDFIDFSYSQSAENPNYQVLSIYDSGAKSMQIVSTNKQPLTTPKASVSASRSHTFSWNDDSTVDYYLINNKTQTRKKVIFDQEAFNYEKPINFRLLTEDLLLIQLENKVLLHRFSSAGYLTFPVTNINHVYAVSTNQLLVFSGSNLEQEQPSSTTQSFGDISQLIEATDETLPELLKVPVDKMYYYNSEAGTFSFLDKLPETIFEPFQIESVMVNNIPTQVLTTQNGSFQVIID